MEVVIKKGGVVELPDSMLAELRLKGGGRAAVSVKDGTILIEPSRSLTDRLTGSIKIDDDKLIEEIVDSEDWLSGDLEEIMRQILIYPGEDGYWVAEVPSLPGCICQGRATEIASRSTQSEGISNKMHNISVSSI